MNGRKPRRPFTHQKLVGLELNPARGRRLIGRHAAHDPIQHMAAHRKAQEPIDGDSIFGAHLGKPGHPAPPHGRRKIIVGGHESQRRQVGPRVGRQHRVVGRAQRVEGHRPARRRHPAIPDRRSADRKAGEIHNHRLRRLQGRAHIVPDHGTGEAHDGARVRKEIVGGLRHRPACGNGNRGRHARAPLPVSDESRSSNPSNNVLHHAHSAQKLIGRAGTGFYRGTCRAR